MGVGPVLDENRPMGRYSSRGRFMSKRSGCVFSALAAVIALTVSANAQSVVSTHSGVIYFFEGTVYLGDQALESHLGTFPCMPRGAELRTAEGRVEVLLTPGVFLRMGEQSSIRLIANDLADTQVELRAGSAIVDSGEPNSGTSVTLVYKDWRVHFLQKGLYRIDSDPPRLWVRDGEAEVVAGPTGQPMSVKSGMSLPFRGVLVPEQAGNEPRDALSDWAHGRGESISADNAITAQIDQDPASATADSDSFTYFPAIGAPYAGVGSLTSYSSLTPYQPGFNSIYLPGYTYPPLILGFLGPGFLTHGPLPPRRLRITPVAATIVRRPVAPSAHVIAHR
jgi:hypothetical protein